MKIYFNDILNFYSKEVNEVFIYINNQYKELTNIFFDNDFITNNIHHPTKKSQLINYLVTQLNLKNLNSNIIYKESIAFGDISVLFKNENLKYMCLSQIDLFLSENQKNKSEFIIPIQIYLKEKITLNIEKNLTFSKQHNSINFNDLSCEDKNIISNFSKEGYNYTNADRRPKSDVVDFFNLIFSLAQYNIEEAANIIFNSELLTDLDIDKLKLIYDLDFSKIENSHHYIFNLEKFLKQKLILDLKI